MVGKYATDTYGVKVVGLLFLQKLAGCKLSI